jgi:hypothetical protein
LDDIARTFCVLDVQSASLIQIDGKSHRKITDVNHFWILRILLVVISHFIRNQLP